jgi:hypothetical protein
MLWTSFSFLVRYVEDEKCFENIVWDDSSVHLCVASELEDLYEWWKFQRPKRDKVVSLLYTQVSDHILGEATEEDSLIYKKLNTLETFWNAQDIYNLKRLVSVKDFMWT